MFLCEILNFLSCFIGMLFPIKLIKVDCKYQRDANVG